MLKNETPLKILFAGTPTFAAVTLQALLEAKKKVVGVLTQPDRPKGRGQKITASPVKQLAMESGIVVSQPVKLTPHDIIEAAGGIRPDLMVVVAYGLILPKSVLATPKLGCINIHGSLLPRWRGAAPIQRAILAGDRETGITVIQMDPGMDTGPMLKKATCPITQTDTSQSLHDALATLGADTLLATLKEVENASLTPVPQPEEGVTYANKIQKEEGLIDWDQPADFIHRQIRAFNPWPVAFTWRDNIRLKIWEAALSDIPSQKIPGTLLQADKNGLVVATKDKALVITKLQLPGKTIQTPQQILSGQKALFQSGMEFHGPKNL